MENTITSAENYIDKYVSQSAKLLYGNNESSIINPRNTINAVIPKKYANLLIVTSHLFIISAIVALYKKYYDFVVINSLYFITSILYWYSPGYDIVRIIDIITVNSGIVYHIYKGYNTKIFNILVVLLSIIAIFYLCSWYYQLNNDLLTATYLHCSVHIVGFITMVTLYTWGINSQK
jgi:hypothetical protein